MEGQYIVKNLLIIGAALVIGDGWIPCPANLRPRRNPSTKLHPRVKPHELNRV